MKRTIILLLVGFSILRGLAQVHNDKNISKILRDNNYISADVRGPSEKEAYEEALKQLSDQVTEYFKSLNYKEMPETVYLSNVSSHYETLTSHISDNRYRVLVYVKKSDLIPMGTGSNSIVLSRGEEEAYQLLSTETPEPVVVTVTDTIVKVLERPDFSNRPVPQQIRKLANIQNGDAVPSKLQEMRKYEEISGASAFPIGYFGDFYILLINPMNEVETILYFDGSIWTDALNGYSIVNPLSYKGYKAFWFTL